MGKFLDEHYYEIFKKYSKSELMNELSSFSSGGALLTKTLEHFFKEVLFGATQSRFKMTPMELLNDDELVEKCIDYVRKKSNFYNPADGDIRNLEKSIHNRGTYTWKVANFRPDEARKIYKQLLPNGGTVYDYCCGWGSRLCAALCSGYDYLGTDPNTKLHIKLVECAEFLHECGFFNNFDIRCTGSEYLHNDWIGKVDLCFSSPPYFNLEIYCDEETQSIHNRNYGQWLKEYIAKTIFNCNNYLKSGGYFSLNIKDLPRQEMYLYSDIERIIDKLIEAGYLQWEKQKPIEIKIGAPKNYDMDGVQTKTTSEKEYAMVYKKL